MTRYLTLREVLILHERVAATSGGGLGVRDLGLLESSIAQPKQSFNDVELYPSLAEKAAALAFFIVSNHPFVDGNKRVGHAAMETFLILNGAQLDATVDEQEHVILQLAAGAIDRVWFADWVRDHLTTITP